MFDMSDFLSKYEGKSWADISEEEQILDKKIKQDQKEKENAERLQKELKLNETKEKLKSKITVGDNLEVYRYVPYHLDPKQFQLVKVNGKVTTKDDDTFTLEFNLKNGQTKEIKYPYMGIVDNEINNIKLLPEGKLPKLSNDRNDMFNTIQILNITNDNKQKETQQVTINIPENANETFFKSNLKIGDILSVKRYIPKKPVGFKLVDNEVIVEKILPNSVRVSYYFDGQKKWQGDILFSNLYTKISDLPVGANYELFVSQIKTTSGGYDPYYLKYLKYKAKYLKLKYQ